MIVRKDGLVLEMTFRLDEIGVIEGLYAILLQELKFRAHSGWLGELEAAFNPLLERWRALPQTPYVLVTHSSLLSAENARKVDAYLMASCQGDDDFHKIVLSRPPVN